MRATKLLLILVFRFGVTEISGEEFFNKALHAGVSAYNLDPMENGNLDYVVKSTLATVNMYRVTAHGLTTVHRAGANFISVNNSGTSLKINIEAQDVTIAVLANVTVSFFISTTDTIKIEVLASALKAQLDIKEERVELKVEDVKILGAETVKVKSTIIAGSSLAFTATRQTI
uniref:Putative secreted protein n=1 Tax=Ixodes ricinus TaxID=34613 RepID=A0A090XB53_IXORI